MHPLRFTRGPGHVLASLGAAAALVAVLAAAGCGSVPAATGGAVQDGAVQSGAVQSGAVPGWAAARLTAIAHRAAAINGDAHPAWITAVLTTRARALTSATPGDLVPGAARVKVFLITMRGDFTATEASWPSGAKAPTGRYLSLVIDARTFEGLDFGISPKPPPVPPATLGPVTYLSGRSAAGA